jgi:hypothetical protein
MFLLIGETEFSDAEPLHAYTTREKADAALELMKAHHEKYHRSGYNTYTAKSPILIECVYAWFRIQEIGVD